MSPITFYLPWPSPMLSPNGRYHPQAKARAAKKARKAAWAYALEAKADRITADQIAVRVTFLCPDKRRRDLDNCIASNKAHFDGIADAVGIDDSKWVMSFGWGENKPGGFVKIELEAVA